MGNSLFGTGYQPKESAGSRQLPAGGYICKIMAAKMENAKSSGLPMVVIQFDISDGEYAQYYRNKYQNDTSRFPDAKWGGIARIPAVDAEGKARNGFNSFCGAVEKSNDITLPQEDTAFLAELKGCYVGIIFGREEYQGRDGNLYWSTKPKFYRSVETIENGAYAVPDDEPIDKGGYSYTNEHTDNFAMAEADIPF